MIDTETKKYIAELCNSLYGYYPKDVVPFQALFHKDDSIKGHFFVKYTTSDSKNDHQGYFEFKCKGYVTDDAFTTTINNQNWYGSDFQRFFMCDEITLRGGTSASGFVVGFECIL